MKLLVDEDTKAEILLSRLRAAGHDVVTTHDLGKDSAADPEIFGLAQDLGRLVLTQNIEDYLELHERSGKSGHHGILVIHKSGAPVKDMSYKDIIQAIANIEASGINPANSFHSLNAWDWAPGETKEQR